jgi:hypothetical protein
MIANNNSYRSLLLSKKICIYPGRIVWKVDTRLYFYASKIRSFAIKTHLICYGELIARCG